MDVRRRYARRVANVAAETGARFARERIDLPPLIWLSTPKQMLGGRTPLDACRTSEGADRILLMHGLSLGLDATPGALDALVARGVLDDENESGWPPYGGSDDDEDEELPLPALYTASVVHADERGAIYILAAMVARGVGEVRRRLRFRWGALLEDAAVVRLGFDWSEPLACAMVSDAMADTLTLVAADPTSPIARGLDFQVEQRFTC
jgi:hypothetical protein